MAGNVVVEKDEGLTKVSKYRWINLVVDETIVGKARIYYWATRMIIYSINVFPEFQRNGYARSVVESYQKQYKTITADSVRGSARGFWKKMGFHPDGKGNYIWKRANNDSSHKQAA